MGTSHRGTRLPLLVTAVAVALLAVGMAPAPGSAAPKPRGRYLATAVTAAPTIVRPRGATVYPGKVRLVQPDGTSFEATRWGDGANHGYQDADGYTIARDEKGTWVYVTGITGTGKAQLGTSAADGSAPATATRLRPRSADPSAGQSGARSLHHQAKGTQTSLVILTRFLNQNTVGTTEAQWANAFFGNTNSVHDYYAKASYGKLNVAPAKESFGTPNNGVVGWIGLSRNHPNLYDLGDSSKTPTELNIVKEAITAASQYVNFKAYDTNNDGVMQTRELHVTLILAGYESSYDTSCGNSVWGHQWSIDPYYGVPAPVVDGVRVAGIGGGFTMFGEAHCDGGGSHMATMGIMVHELGHDMGLPDMYSYDNDYVGEVGKWSIMSYGSWLDDGGFPGSSPAEPDAWTRTYQGWVQPTQVRGTNKSITLPAVESTGTIYRVANNPNNVDWAFSNDGDQKGTGEYWLIENRQQTGYDSGLPGCGILIWHIDETRDTDSPNTPSGGVVRNLVALEQADGLDDLRDTDAGDSGDPYPGSSGNTTFSNTSNPNSRYYAGTASGITVTVPAGACSANKTITVSSPNVATPAPFPSWESLITRQFADIWGKLPTSAQVASWVTYIKANFGGQYKLVSDLRANTENKSNVDPVARLYRAYFLRNPDDSGFSFWVGQKRKGKTLTAISSSFAASGEFTTTYGSLSNRAFVEQVYLNVLGRAGEQSGIDYWTGQLDQSKKTRGQVMVGFSESNEYKVAQRLPVQISVLYLQMLHRAPTPAEITKWSAYGTALDNKVMATEIMNDPEYSARF